MTRPDVPPPPADAKPRARRLGFLILGAVVLIAAAIYLVMRLLAPPSAETDDSYVGGNIVAVTARDGGTVLSLNADNTQMVKRGETLVKLDPATVDVELASAEAELGRAVRAVRSDQSQVDEAGAEIAQARANLGKAQNDYTRR